MKLDKEAKIVASFYSSMGAIFSESESDLCMFNIILFWPLCNEIWYIHPESFARGYVSATSSNQWLIWYSFFQSARCSAEETCDDICPMKMLFQKGETFSLVYPEIGLRAYTKWRTHCMSLLDYNEALQKKHDMKLLELMHFLMVCLLLSFNNDYNCALYLRIH